MSAPSRLPANAGILTSAVAWPLRPARVAGGTVAVLLLFVAGIYATGADRRFGDLALLTASMAAGASCALAAHRAAGRLRLAWWGLAFGALSWGLGQAVWSWYELVLHVDGPFPGLSDVGYLCFPIGAAAALVVFPSSVPHGDRVRMVLDGLTTAGAIGLVSWAAALGAVVHASTSTLGTAVSVTYPLSDIALLIIAVPVLARSGPHRLPLGLVVGGLSLMWVADSGYAYLVAKGAYDTGNPIDLGWVFAFGLLALAPLMPGATEASRQVDSRMADGTVLPYIPLGVAVGFIGWQYAHGTRPAAVEATLAALTVVLVLLRQYLTMRDNRLLAVALTEREAQLRHLAFHDQLTGLANRALFLDRVSHALELHHRDGRPLAICFVDLDGFKTVNDSLGHSAGDHLLQEVSARFQTALGGADTLARLGGDEFAVLLEDQQDPTRVARALLECLRVPLLVQGRDVMRLASIGVAHVSPQDPTPSVDEMLVRADLAMYVVKRRGKGDVLLHMQGLALAEVDDALMGDDLARAIENKEITLAFQPVVDLSSGRLDSLEALARWAPGGRPISPEVFVRAAEACGLADPLFRLVLAQACKQLARWSALPGGSDLRVAVNLSPCQLSGSELVDLVAGELFRWDLDGDRLILEITETGPLPDTAAAHAVCRELRELGVALSVDDFGTGLSSMARLRDLPIDEVKIDRSFITAVDHDSTRARFVRGVLAFAEGFGLTVVAEGIEREEERDALIELGCHRAQGYLFSRPLPAHAVGALLRSPRNWLAGIDDDAGRLASEKP